MLFRSLQKSRPALQTKGAELYTIRGLLPDLSKAMAGCPFAPRCEHANDECVRSETGLREIEPLHHTACVRIQKGDLKLGYFAENERLSDTSAKSEA